MAVSAGSGSDQDGVKAPATVAILPAQIIAGTVKPLPVARVPANPFPGQPVAPDPAAPTGATP